MFEGLNVIDNIFIIKLTSATWLFLNPTLSKLWHLQELLHQLGLNLIFQIVYFQIDWLDILKEIIDLRTVLFQKFWI